MTESQAHRNLASAIFQQAIADLFGLEIIIRKFSDDSLRQAYLRKEAKRLYEKKHKKVKLQDCYFVVRKSLIISLNEIKKTYKQIRWFLRNASIWSSIIGLDMGAFWSAVQQKTLAERKTVATRFSVKSAVEISAKKLFPRNPLPQ